MASPGAVAGGGGHEGPPGAPVSASGRRGFYPMPRGDRVFLVALLLLAFAGFLPWARAVRWGDMVALGWLMAGLMVFSPLVALLRLWLSRPGASADLARAAAGRPPGVHEAAEPAGPPAEPPAGERR